MDTRKKNNPNASGVAAPAIVKSRKTVPSKKDMLMAIKQPASKKAAKPERSIGRRKVG